MLEQVAFTGNYGLLEHHFMNCTLVKAVINVDAVKRDAIMLVICAVNFMMVCLYIYLHHEAKALVL